MIYKVEVSQQADNDLRDIFEYIAYELHKMCEKPTSLDVGDSADIDVYKGSPIAQTGDIDINLDIINSIVNEGKSLDDVLDSLNYESEGKSIEDQLTVGNKVTENNKNDTDVSNDADKTTDTNDEVINNSQDQTEQRIKIFEDVVNDVQCYLGKCKWGTEWYQKTLDNGKQIWVEVYKNTIREAGINDEPKAYNSKIGLKE